MRNLRMDVSVGVIALVCLIGCSGGPSDLPDLGKVTGTVTVDGTPAGNVIVSFNPTAGGRPSSGTTDAQGRYELVYSTQYMGAIVGKHKVTVNNKPPEYTAEQMADPNITQQAPTGPITEQHAGWLTEVEVQAGNNTIDLNVTAPAAK